MPVGSSGPDGPKPVRTAADGDEGLTWEDPFAQGEDSERLHAVLDGYEAAYDAWRASEAAGDLATAQQGALVYAEAVGAMLATLEGETFSADYQDSADSVLRVTRDAVASARAASVAPTLEEYDAAVKAGYGEVGARTELKVLLLWV